MKKILLFLSFNIFTCFTLKAQITILDDVNSSSFQLLRTAKVGTVTIPADGYYRITVKGASGGSKVVDGGFVIPTPVAGGKGGVFSSDFYFSQGTVLEYCLGANGESNLIVNNGGAGGGGGTGVRLKSNGSILAIAGGGGGANRDFYIPPLITPDARGYDSPGDGSGGGPNEPFQNTSFGSGGGGINGKGQDARWDGAVDGTALSPFLVIFPGIQAYGGGAGFNALGGYTYASGGNATGFNRTGLLGGGGYGGGGASSFRSYLPDDPNPNGGAGGGGGYSGGFSSNNSGFSRGGTSYHSGYNASQFTASNIGPGAIKIEKLPPPSFVVVNNASCASTNSGANGVVQAVINGGYDDRVKPFKYQLSSVNGTNALQLENIFYNVPAGPVFIVILDGNNQPMATVSGTVSITVPSLPLTSNGTINPSICFNSSATLTATCAGDNVKWYDESGTVSLGTGSSFTTPNLTSNTTYKVRCETATCASAFVEVSVTQITSLSNLAVNTNVVCDGGSITLSASCTSGTVTWYNQEIGGTALGTGNEFIYSPSSSSRYYAACESANCVTTRVATDEVLVNPVRLYVNKSATGLNSGESWENAITDLQTALNTCPSVTEIWVAKGTYKPAAANGDRNLRFNIRNNLKLYGGFAGTETSLNDRDRALLHTTNLTTLSGDLNGDDGADFANNSENSNTVVYLEESSTTTRLDGFTVTGGNNTTGAIPSGGGIYGFVSNATIANCIISGNSANNQGGGVYNLHGSLTFENCVFTENRSLQFGGAIFNNFLVGTGLTVNVVNCTFINNTTPGGTGSILYNNVGTSSSGLQVNFTHCSFTGNTGGFSITNNTSSTNIQINALNSIFFWNSGSQTIQDWSPVNATNCLFDQQTINYIGNNNLTTGTLPFVSNTDLNLTCNSLAKNNGTNVGIPSTDLNGKPRPYANTPVDIGAYELQAGTTPSNVEVSRTDICQADIVQLSATCEGGVVTWYTQSSGGTPIGTGATFSQKPMADVTYYASCEDGICTATRAATQAVVVSFRPQAQTVTENLNADAVKLAGSSVTATSTILAPARVSFQAGRMIELNAGFEAQNGSTFEAKIGGCENSFVNGMVAYYPFNGNANDESANNNNGIVNGATLTTDRFGNPNKAYAFDGINDRINANVGAEMYSAEITISVWAAISGAGGQFNPRLVGVGRAGSSIQYYSLIIEGNSSPRRIQFFTQGAVADGYSNTLVPNGSGWQHYTVTYDATKVKVFINGILDSERNRTGALANFSNALLQIGYSDNGFDWFDGKLDDIRIYNRALTNDEVLQLYNAEKPTEAIDLASGLVAYYPFNGSADDEAGNNNGVVNGATLTADRYGNNGKAFGFDGNDYIEIPNAPSLNLNYTTLSFWVNARSSSEVVSYLITKGWDFEQNYGIYVNNGNKGIEMQGRVGSNWLGAYSPPNTLTLNQWNHVTGVFDGNKFTIYINGLKSTENAATGLLTVNNQNLFLGRNSTINSGSAYWLNGSLDDVRIYNRALSEAEIQAIYNAEKP